MTPQAITGERLWGTPIERFYKRISPEPFSGCWLWMGIANKTTQYGHFHMAGRQELAHRAAVILHGREIPKGKVVDHLCRTHCCVNPAHLEVVDQKVNVARGNMALREKSKTHCPRGHAYDIFSGNTRWCRTCKNVAGREWKRANRA